jgi:hypothetical protein
MKKILSASLSIALIVSVALLSLYALGVLGGDGISRVDVKDYTEFTFTGDLRNGRFTGYGSMTFPDGVQYSGNFAAGRFDGEGILSYAVSNWTFTGVFQEGRAVGGIFRDPAGETVAYERGETGDALEGIVWRYEGGFNDRGQNGTGTFTFADGSVYTGGFSRGLAEGEGTYTDASGRTVYAGDFKEGRFDGQGRYFSPEDWMYEGSFKEGLFDGQGTLTTETETSRGIWEKGVQITRYE